MDRASNDVRQRVYQQWQGNEVFFCGGLLMAGPDWKSCMGSGFLVGAPSIIFLVFVAPYMGAHVHVVILVISCILPALSILFLGWTACRDPGIIPRQQPDEEFLAGKKCRVREEVVNGHRVSLRYNETTHFYQPPRAHHCSINDNCIDKFDHHCPWVGNTIGRRNYRTFLLFVYCTATLCLYVFGVCMAQLFVRHAEIVASQRARQLPEGNAWLKTATDCAPALVLIAYTFLSFFFVGGLSGFHTYLVATNQTTYENFRTMSTQGGQAQPNPFDQGWVHNCAEVWCTPTPPSQVNFRAYIEPRMTQTTNPIASVGVITEMEEAGSMRGLPQRVMLPPPRIAAPHAPRPPHHPAKSNVSLATVVDVLLSNRTAHTSQSGSSVSGSSGASRHLLSLSKFIPPAAQAASADRSTLSTRSPSTPRSWFNR